MNSLRGLRPVVIAATTYLALSCAAASDSTAPLAWAESDLSGWSTGGTGSVALACTESWTRPTYSSSGKRVNGARWISARIPVELTVSGVIGPAGGSLAIPGSQFVIHFPKDALPVPTAITITSKESPWITYDMAPHGTVFRKPVYVFQGLENTAIFGTPEACSAYGAYLPAGSEDIDPDDTATATETTMSFTISGTLPWLQLSSPQTSIWVINHFSRYMLASG